jgi:hypothetical protein
MKKLGVGKIQEGVDFVEGKNLSLILAFMNFILSGGKSYGL